MRIFSLLFIMCLSLNAFGFTTYEKVKFAEQQLGKALGKLNLTLIPESINFKRPYPRSLDSSAEIITFVAKQDKIGYKGEVRLFEASSTANHGWSYGYVSWNHVRPDFLAPAICPNREYTVERAGLYLGLGSVKTYSNCTGEYFDLNSLNLDLKVLPYQQQQVTF